MNDDGIQTWCSGCVYHPPNLPRSAYDETAWQELQDKTCAYDCAPGGAQCLTWRKTSCSLVDLERLKTERR